jgi:hypothetical protein
VLFSSSDICYVRMSLYKDFAAALRMLPTTKNTRKLAYSPRADDNNGPHDSLPSL